MAETKSEIRARLAELDAIADAIGAGEPGFMYSHFDVRRAELLRALEAAEEDMESSVIRSHVAVCKAKQMDMKAAYGQDPALYYSAAICAEAGECLNKIVRGLRNGNNRVLTTQAVISELPDILIYSFVLAYVLGLDLRKLVADKATVVIERAESGYYGGPLAIDSVARTETPE
jgi:NTP pyrophosphatase (non-canonical NTP hydrolase)